MDALKKATAASKAAKTATPVMEATPGRTDEVQNTQGAFVFQVGDKDRLERFLILGTTGGTFYVGEQELTNENINFVKRMIATDERLVVDTAVDVSVNGRALRQTPAIFTIAAVMTFGQDKAYAVDAVQKIVRTSTHLFEYVQFIDDMGGWGRSKRRSVANWYTGKTADQLAYQAVKYRQRDGWTHRDVMRLSHPTGVDASVGEFILRGNITPESPETLRGFEAMRNAQSVKEVVAVLNEHKNLPWETIPTQFLKDVTVWKTLFHNGALNGQALVRNVTRLARIGAFKDMVFAAEYAARLTDEQMIARTRLHPINFLNAYVVFTEGQVQRDGYYGWYGYRTAKDWDTNPVIADALQEGFHLAFKHVEPANKRTLLGIDVSGSMSSAMGTGLDLSAAQISAAIAMTVARTEPYHLSMGFAHTFRDLGITPKQSFTEVMRRVQLSNFGSTNISLPMEYALKNRIEVDTFVVITDNDLNTGRRKPFQALKDYRDKMGIDARLAVLGVVATDFTVADPQDRGMMDFVGFDSNGPKVLADFSAGRL